MVCGISAAIGSALGVVGEDGEKLDGFPSMRMTFTFEQTDAGSRLTNVTYFPSHEALEQVVAMGAVEGSRMAMDQLDAVLVSLREYAQGKGTRTEILDDIRDTLFGAGPFAQGEYLAVRETRVGFVGTGLPAEALPELGIPASAPLLFGFHSVHKGSQATEPSITIPRGPLADGTTQHVSRIELAVQRWHARSRDEQAALMYAPTVTAAPAVALSEVAPHGSPPSETPS